MTDGQESLQQRIRNARAKFAAMAGTYFVGAFNDNYFKQTALLMAVAMGMSWIQTWATVIFTLPFLLFAAWAGWLADRFPKRSIVIVAKVFELAAMTFGALGVLYGNWILILTMLFIEGTQATIFSPALNGSIPELYPAEYVVTANAIVRVISTVSILGGLALAGFVLDIKGFVGDIALSRLTVAVIVITVSISGVLMSFAVGRFPAAAPNAKFPWRGPAETLKLLYNIRLDSMLAVAIAANSFFWFLGALEVLLLNQLGLSQFNWSYSRTSCLAVAELLGIAAGGLLSSWLTKKLPWQRLVAPSGFAIAICMFLTGYSCHFPDSIRFSCLIAILAVMGVAGGVYMIPLEAFIQVRPAPDRKGEIIAAANFAAFTGILLAGPLLYLFDALTLAPTTDFTIMSAVTLAVAVLLFFYQRTIQT